MSTRVLVLAALLVTASSVAAQPVAHTPGDVVAFVESLFGTVAGGDAQALDGMLAESALLIEEAPELAVQTKEDVLAGAVGKRDIALGLTEDGVRLVGDMAFVSGKVGEPKPDTAFQAVCLWTEGRWQLELLVVGAEPADELPGLLDPILKDISADDTTGMQAALAYLAEDPCLAVVAGPGFQTVMPDRKAIETQVGQWAPPTDVVTNEPEFVGVSGSERLAVVRFGSTFHAGQQPFGSYNLVCLTKVDGQWRIVAFVAALAPPEEPAAAEE
jgi:hypothetical protein